MIDKLKSVSPLLAQRPPQASRGVDTTATQPNDGMQWSTGDGGFKLASPPKFDTLQEADKPQVKAQGLAEIGKKVGLGAALALTAVVGMAGVANAQTAQVQTVRSNVTAGQPVAAIHFIENPTRPPAVITANSAGVLLASRGPSLVAQGDCVACIAHDVDPQILA